ncbi:MAG: hypothetical protein D6788_01150 [Planctomycetota bacterium]|nr:MAG: hypothetical protein D6788_01150 [Planctomycetota bacterium]
MTVQFRNFTAGEAVDVGFFVSPTPPVVLPDDLFVEENRFLTSVGVAGTGIVQPLSQDIIEIPCSEGLTLGTSGGRFVDNETGELRGVGQPRWVQEGPLALCDAIVTFEFDGDGTEFTTRVLIGNRE